MCQILHPIQAKTIQFEMAYSSIHYTSKVKKDLLSSTKEVTTVIVKVGAEESSSSVSGDIRGSLSLSRSSSFMPTETIPEPCLNMNAISFGLVSDAAIIMFPSMSPFSSSTTITN